MFDTLFQPMKIGTLEIKNRFVMPAMNSHCANTEHLMTERGAYYYGERAKGGFGLLITEFICISEEGLAGRDQAAIYDDRFIPGLAAVTKRVHQEGGRIFAQLQHSGRRQGVGATELPAVGASNIPEAWGVQKVHELTTEEVQVIIEKYVQAALRAQAAWILAKRGHDVQLFEKEDTVGGQYRLASVPPMKQDLAKTISTYHTFCIKNGVRIHCGTTFGKENLEKEHFDEIILATGSVPVIPRIEGIDGEQVCTAQQVLRCERVISRKQVIVLGAGLVGAETAEFLTTFGNTVTLVDMLDKIAPLAPPKVRNDLVKRLEHNNVAFYPGCKVSTILKDGIEYTKNGKTEVLSGYDSIVLAFGSRPDQTLLAQIQDIHPNVHLIGDARKAGDAKKAIFEATELALTL